MKKLFSVLVGLLLTCSAWASPVYHAKDYVSIRMRSLTPEMYTEIEAACQRQVIVDLIVYARPPSDASCARVFVTYEPIPSEPAIIIDSVSVGNFDRIYAFGAQHPKVVNERQVHAWLKRGF